MKKLVALLLAVPRLAWADESSYFEATAEPASPEPAPVEVAKPVEADLGPALPVEPVDVAPAPSSEALSYGAEVDVASRYVFRGIAFSEHPVLQPSARVTHYGATFGVSSSAYLGTEPGVQETVSELDLTGRYDYTVGAATFSPSIGAYLYPHAPSTAELSTTVSYDLTAIALLTHQFLDVADNAGGYWADFGAARTQPLTSRLRLDAAATLGWCSGSFGRYYIDESISGLHWGAAQLDSALTLTATDTLYFRLHGTVSRMLEEQLRHFGPDENILSGGLALGMTR